MNIVIANIGSQGDIQPYIALANGLNRKGYQTFIATHPYAKQLATAISKTKHDVRMKEKVIHVSQVIAEEKGVEKATELIGKHIDN